MSVKEFELRDEVESLTSDWGIEEADEGDTGYYVYVNGGYLPNTYQSYEECYEAILEHLR
ncbi:hypothetical protein PQZ64_gp45 [Klebsiella phage vB_KpnM_IME346]|uniref:Uncharacterized protein n=1 Tax=Klebsiella phage vB_KpnM_IME346 TaxID=2562174 RepID=A0A4D6DRX0_9CAUD|nr:hypothetical protein PQZ64_gp45 [Klebsiella phage vB_KpnM_IME346]QBZ68944.1 hypothetical protein [Klebsiella phage vB_KpnM_IME346]